MNAWGRAEGGGGYGSTGEGAFNWLNTRRGAGANWSQPNFQTGVHNTIGALEDGYYPQILQQLRSGRSTPQTLATLVARSPWGTHDGVLRVLGAGPAPLGGMGPGSQPTPTKLGVTGGTSAPMAATAPTTSSGVDPALLSSMLMQSVSNTAAGHFDMSGLLALAADRRAAYAAAGSSTSPTSASLTPGGHGFSGPGSYLNPIPKGSSFERTDQGVDYRVPVGYGVPALGDMKIVRVSQDAGGFGKAVYGQLLSGPHAGKYVYVGHAEPLVTAGQVIRRGQPLARALQHPLGNAGGDPGHIEIGWASGPYGPLGQLGSSGVGSDFLSFLNSL